MFWYVESQSLFVQTVNLIVNLFDFETCCCKKLIEHKKMEGQNGYYQPAPTAPNEALLTNGQNKQQTVPVVFVAVPANQNPYGGQPVAQAGPYGHPHPPPHGYGHPPPHHHQAPYGGPIDDPSSVWCFLVMGFFFPICCLVGLCVTNPNNGPRTASAYKTLKTMTCIWFVIVVIYIIVSASSAS